MTARDEMPSEPVGGAGVPSAAPGHEMKSADQRRVSPWRISLRRGKTGLADGGANRRPALLAKLRPAGRSVPHEAHVRGKASPALQAELRLGGILVLAPGTLHLTLTSPGGDGRDGGTKLAPGLDRVNNGFWPYADGSQFDGLADHHSDPRGVSAANERPRGAVYGSWVAIEV